MVPSPPNGPGATLAAMLAATLAATLAAYDKAVTPDSGPQAVCSIGADSTTALGCWAVDADVIAPPIE